MHKQAWRCLPVVLSLCFTLAMSTSAVAQTVSFTSRGEVPVGGGPFWVAAGDFNGDNAKDLVTANRGTNDVSVLLGNRDGTFQPARTFATGGGPAFVVAGDFDGDGVQDVATADYNSGTVSLLRGAGDGTFGAPRAFPAGGTNPNCLAVGDFNRDGALDLAAALFGGNEVTATTVTVLLGTGLGTFQAAQPYTVQRGPLWVAVGEFNGDGFQDLAVANFGVDTVSVLLGNGNGTFRSAVSFPGGNGAASVIAGEFNHDGRQDLAIVDYREPFQVQIAPGNGDGTFGLPLAVPVGPSPATIAMADLNQDGVLDLAVPNWHYNAGNTVSLLIGNGNGTFVVGNTVLAGRGVLGVAAEDLTGDGRPDLAISNYAGNTVSILINDGGSAPTTYLLSVQKSGTGGGTVASAPAGIHCGLVCSASYPSGSVVTLTATPDTGSTFAGWSGAACSGTGACSVTMDAARTVTATFSTVPSQFALTVARTGDGNGTVSSSPAGIDCGSTCSASYGSGTVVTLTATSAAGSIFTGWSGAGCAGTGTCTVTMDAAKSVAAGFTRQRFTLSVGKQGNGTGSVTSSPAGIDCGSTCSASYEDGTVVTLTATAASGSMFTGWSGAGCSGTGTCSVTMGAAKSVVATFVRQRFTLTVQKHGLGSGTVTSTPSGISCGGTCSATFDGGTLVTLRASPGLLSAFTGWSGGGCSGTGTCTIDLRANTTVTASFKLLSLL